MNGKTLVGVFVVLICVETQALAAPVGTAFTYQGRLHDGGNPAQGLYDLRFAVYDEADGGSLWGVLTNSATPVNDGLFTVTLGFGSGVFDGGARWLDIGVRTNGGAVFTGLNPRQPLTPTPYAMQAAHAATADSATTAANATTALTATTAASVPAAGIGPGTANINISGNANTAISAAAAGSAAVAATAVSFSGPLAGDVTGTQAATTVERVRGVQVAPAAPTASQHLRFDGTQWVPAAIALGTDVSGTLDDARLSSNVALLNGSQAFTAPNTFASAVTATNPANVFAGAFTGNGVVPWQAVGGASLSAAPNTGYVLTNAGLTTVILPETASVGQVVTVSGAGAGGWQVAACAGQEIVGATGPAGVTWTPHESSRNWWSVASSADGTRLVGAVDGGYIYTSADSGAAWTNRASSLGWLAVASSADGSRLVGGTAGAQLYTSTDFGATWTPRESARQWFSAASSADGTRLVAVDRWSGGNYGRIYTSTDAGTNWTARESNRNWYAVASSADGCKLVAAAFDDQLYTSTDSGVTWTARAGVGKWRAVASSADGTRLVAAVYTGKIYTSTDAGTNWTARGSDGYWMSVASSADGTRIAAAHHWTASSGIYVSSDSGVTWTARAGNADWRSVASSADGTKLVAAVSLGQIYTSTATAVGAQGSTATFQYIGSGQWLPLNESQVAPGAVGTAQLAGGAVGSAQLAPNLTVNGTFTGNGAGLANLAAANLTGTVPDARLSANVALLDRNQTFSAANTFAGAVTATNPANVFAGSFTGAFTGNGIFPWQVIGGTTQNAAPNTGYLSTNADLTAVMLPETASIGDVVAVSGVGEGGWLAAAGTGQTIVGADGPAGVTWTPLWSGDTLSRLASSADGRRLIGARWAGVLYTSVDGGVSWTARETARYWTALASSADGRKLVAAVGFGGQIYTSTDAGTNWTARGSSQSWTSVASSADGARLAALGSSHLFTSTDAGTNWIDRGSAWGYMIASSADGNTLVWPNDYSVYVSADAGASWTERMLAEPVQHVASSADGTRLIAANELDGHLWVSADSGASWVARGSSQRWRYVASSSDGRRLFAVAEFYVPDDPESWTRCAISADAGAHWAMFEVAGWTSSFAASADGTKLASCISSEFCTSAATLYGAQGTTARLQYIGSGRWLPLNTAQLAAGAVGEAQLAPSLNAQIARLDASPVFTTPVTLGSFLSLARTTIAPVAGDTLAPTGSYLLLDPAGAVTLSGVTAIASGARVGDVLVLQGNSDANTVTVPNGANTRLAATTRVLGANDMLVLMWAGVAWTELSFADN